MSGETTYSCRPHTRMGIPDSSQWVIEGPDGSDLIAFNPADAAYFTALLNLTTREQRDKALFSLCEKAAAE